MGVPGRAGPGWSAAVSPRGAFEGFGLTPAAGSRNEVVGMCRAPRGATASPFPVELRGIAVSQTTESFSHPPTAATALGGAVVEEGGG